MSIILITFTLHYLFEKWILHFILFQVAYNYDFFHKCDKSLKRQLHIEWNGVLKHIGSYSNSQLWNLYLWKQQNRGLYLLFVVTRYKISCPTIRMRNRNTFCRCLITFVQITSSPLISITNVATCEPPTNSNQ